VSSRKLRFDGWVLDPESGDLERAGTRIRLQEQPVQVLRELIAHARSVVTREQLIALLWPKGVVDFDTGLNTVIRKLRRALGDTSETPRYIETLPRRGYRFIGALDPDSDSPSAESSAEPASTSVARIPPPREKSIAVLPFLDLSEKHDHEYFADGMAEEILNRLANIPELTVIGRTSSFSFKGKQGDLPSIGRALRVAYIIEGSVRPARDRIRITAQLIDARDGSHRWSDTFEGATNDAFRLQDEIAVRVAHSLNLEVSGPLPRREAIPPEAYDYYLRGLRELDAGASNNLDTARTYFQRALALAPQFAPAAVEIAEADFANYVSGLQSGIYGPRAHAAIDTALKLDSQNADAYAIRAEILTVFDWDWANAEVDIQKATDLGGGTKSKYAAARLAIALGDLARGRRVLEEVLATNPFDPNPMFRMGLFVELESGHFAEAESWMRRALQISPRQSGSQYDLGVIQLVRGKLGEALAPMKQEKTNEGQLVGLALVYAAMGRTANSDAALDAMQQSGHYFPSDFAHVYALRGDSERALDYIEKAYAIHDPYLWSIKADPLLKSVRQEPRYKAFLRKMNLPE
jgi:TolB-like protein/tetratricopeptide (TPR) repeat protein